MTYSETVEYLFTLLPVYQRVGKAAYKASLDVTIELDRRFGHPHRRFRTIHVAGTNGKGSVSHMLASILQEAGWKTGLYTSPHLTDFRERIRVDGKMISEEAVVAFVKQYDGMIEEIRPSFFELTVAMAFDWFARQQVEVAVIEVGMGGRLDSTNIITPDVSVITNIGHDHMEFLGDTLKAVAGEKAGIIKRGVPVVIGEWDATTSGVFVSRATEMEAPISFAGRTFSCRLGKVDPESLLRHYRLTRLQDGTALRGVTPLGGLAQRKNLQTVATVAQLLAEHYGVTDDHLLRGVAGVVANTGLLGRWQVLSRVPFTVCDTGHNREGLEYLMRQLRSSGRERLHIVIGFVNDKDIGMVLPLFPADACYYFTQASLPRALDSRLLKKEAEKYHLRGEAWPTVEGAVAAARAAAGENEMIFIGGSTFVVADALAAFRRSDISRGD